MAPGLKSRIAITRLKTRKGGGAVIVKVVYKIDTIIFCATVALMVRTRLYFLK